MTALGHLHPYKVSCQIFPLPQFYLSLTHYALYDNCPPIDIATPVACSYIDDVHPCTRRAFKLLCPNFSAMIFSGTSALNILVMDVALNE